MSNLFACFTSSKIALAHCSIVYTVASLVVFDWKQ